MSLVGDWTVDPDDQRALSDLGSVLMEFRPGGELIYTLAGGEKAQVMLMTYEVRGSEIVTNQPSNPRIERTSFELEGDDTLILAFGGTPYRFKRMR